MLYSLVVIVILAVAIPVLAISGFIIGYNVNANENQKIFTKKVVPEKTKDQKEMEYIENYNI